MRLFQRHAGHADGGPSAYYRTDDSPEASRQSRSERSECGSQSCRQSRARGEPGRRAQTGN